MMPEDFHIKAPSKVLAMPCALAQRFTAAATTDSRGFRSV